MIVLCCFANIPLNNFSTICLFIFNQTIFTSAKKDEVVGEELKLIFLFHLLKEIPDVILAHIHHLPALLADKVVVQFIGYQFIDRGAGAHIRNGYFTIADQSFESTVDSGLVDSRKFLADCFIDLQ